MNAFPQLHNTSRSLQSVQQSMQAAIMRPGGMAPPPLRSNGNSESLFAGAPSLSAAQGLGIYQSAYQARLCECLENEYPVLRKTVGEDAFRQFATSYLRRFPSTSYTLGRLSERFIDYFRDTRLPRSTTIEDAPDWADYVIDIATLEHTINQVFNGPGAETRRRIGPADLARIAAVDWPHIRFNCDPSLRLLELRFPVHLQLQSDRCETVRRGLQPQRTLLAVFRRRYAVRWNELSNLAFGVLQKLLGGEALGSAITAAAVLDGADEQMILDAMRWITSKGLLIELEQQQTPVT